RRAINAQNVESIFASSGVCGFDCCGPVSLIGLGSQQLFNNRRRGFFGDPTDIAHGLGLDCGDTLVRFSTLALESSFRGGTFGLCFALAFFVSSFSNRSSLGARSSQFLLVSSNGVVRILLKAGSLLEILCDTVTTVFDHAADTRKNHARQE